LGVGSDDVVVGQLSHQVIDSLLGHLRTTDPSLTLLDDLKDVRELVLNRALQGRYEAAKPRPVVVDPPPLPPLPAEDLLEAAWQIISNDAVNIKREHQDGFSRLVVDLVGNRALVREDLNDMDEDDVTAFAAMMPKITKKKFEEAMLLLRR